MGGGCSCVKKKAGDSGAEPDENGRIDFDAVYRNGGIIGISPEEIGRMTLRQFELFVEGWNKAHGGETVQAPTEEEFEQWKEAINDNG